MQLVAYGAQDIYLTGNPQITFFKVVYRRHTNFAMESVEQTLNGSTSKNGKAVATVSRNGDLVGRMYVECLLQGTGANQGAELLNEVVVEIGGQQIDKHYGRWLEAWAELTEPNPTGAKMTTAGTVTDGTLFQNMSSMGGVTDDASTLVFIPLQFWFNRNPGLALPLIALQYHEVKVSITWGNVTSMANTKLYADYIYLDTDERRRFAQVSHEYLIEQVQSQSFTGGATMDLTFNHPVKELVWTGAVSAGVTLAALTANKTWQLKLNGHDRMAARDVKYYTRAQIHAHHTGFGGVQTRDSIGVYSFALKPEEHQPSGTCNFSRIDNAQLVTSGTDDVHVYAVNYNVGGVMWGMGGVAYSN